jgi:hypothetical protein
MANPSKVGLLLMELYIKKKIEKQQQELNQLQNFIFTTGKWDNGKSSPIQFQNFDMLSALSNIRASRPQACSQVGYKVSENIPTSVVNNSS